MAFHNRAKMTTATAGQGTLTLGSASDGFVSFADAGVVDAETVTYCIEDGDDFEVGRGVYTASGTTLTRATVLLSKIGGSAGTTKLTLSGTAIVYITAAAEDIEVAGTAAAAIVTHEAALDPHPQYLTAAEGDTLFLTPAEGNAAYQPLDAELTAWGALATSAKADSSLTLTAGAGLTGGGDLSAGRTFDVGAGTGILANANDVAVDKASDANVRAAVSNKVVTADLIESASAFVAITNQSPASWDWDSAINFSLTISQNTEIATPSNTQIGTWRTILVQGNDATDRTITFSGDYHGEVPTITDCDSGRWYQLMIFCVHGGHFVVSAKKAFGT
jgi:hypothetical protein